MNLRASSEVLYTQSHLLISGITFPIIALYKQKKRMLGICHREISYLTTLFKRSFGYHRLRTTGLQRSEHELSNVAPNPSFLLQTRQVEGAEAVGVL